MPPRVRWVLLHIGEVEPRPLAEVVRGPRADRIVDLEFGVRVQHGPDSLAECPDCGSRATGAEHQTLPKCGRNVGRRLDGSQRVHALGNPRRVVHGRCSSIACRTADLALRSSMRA